MGPEWQLILTLAGQVSPWGLCALFVVALITGKVVPRSTLEDYKADRDQWREAHRVSEEARALDAQATVVSASQVTELLEHSRTADAFIRAAVGRSDT